MITNTNKKRGLADSKYNELLAECRKALEYLSRGMDIKSLGDISLDQFTQLQELIPDRTVLARARHVVSENQRVLESVKSLMNGDLETFMENVARDYLAKTSLTADFYLPAIGNGVSRL